MIGFVESEDDRNKVVSALTAVEARSTICRLRNGKALNHSEATLALRKLEAEIRRVSQQPLTGQVMKLAESLVDLHLLRALDAVQLGCAVIARHMFRAKSVRFISSDKALLNAAEAEGFDVWDPTT